MRRRRQRARTPVGMRRRAMRQHGPRGRTDAPAHAPAAPRPPFDAACRASAPHGRQREWGVVAVYAAHGRQMPAARWREAAANRAMRGTQRRVEFGSRSARRGYATARRCRSSAPNAARRALRVTQRASRPQRVTRRAARGVATRYFTRGSRSQYANARRARQRLLIVIPPARLRRHAILR